MTQDLHVDYYAEVQRLRAALARIRSIASGEEQVANDDAEGMQVIVNVVNEVMPVSNG